jgi:hypothetical protein
MRTLAQRRLLRGRRDRRIRDVAHHAAEDEGVEGRDRPPVGVADSYGRRRAELESVLGTTPQGSIPLSSAPLTSTYAA